MTTAVRKPRALIILASLCAACAVLCLSAPASATLSEAQVWKSPTWNVPGLFTPTDAYTYNGASTRIRVTVVQTYAYSPIPLPPPGFPPAITPGTMGKVWGTGVGTNGDLGFAAYSLDSSRAELSLRCQSMSMVDTYGAAGNPELVNIASVQCSIYTHAVGIGAWSYSATGTVAAGALVYRPIASGGHSTGYWIVPVALSSGMTFTAWVQ